MIEPYSEKESPGESYKLKKKTTVIQPKRANTMLRRHESDETRIPNFLLSECYRNQVKENNGGNMINGNMSKTNLYYASHVTEDDTSLSALDEKAWTEESSLALKKALTRKNMPNYACVISKQISRHMSSKRHSTSMNRCATKNILSNNEIPVQQYNAFIPKSQIDFIPFVKNGVKSFCFQLSCDPNFSEKLRVLPVTALEDKNIRRLQNNCGELYDLNEMILTECFIKKTMLATFLELCRYHCKCRVALYENIQKDLLEDYKAMGNKSEDFLKYRPHMSAIHNLATYLLGEIQTNKLQETEGCRILPYPEKKKNYWDTKLWCYFFQKKKHQKKKKSKSVLIYKLDAEKKKEYDSLSSDISVHYSSDFSSSSSSSSLKTNIFDEPNKKNVHKDTIHNSIEARRTEPKFSKISKYQTINSSFSDSLHSNSSYSNEDINALQGRDSTSSEMDSSDQDSLHSHNTITRINFSKKIKKRFRLLKMELNRLHCTTHCKLQCNNLFKCASINLFGTRDYHIWVRHHVVAHISDMRDRYIPFFPSEKIFIKYLFEISDKDTCGDFLCLKAIADSFVCSLHVIMGKKTIRHFKYNPVDSNNQSVKPLRDLLFCYIYPTYYLNFYFGVP